MKKIFSLLIAALWLTACGGGPTTVGITLESFKIVPTLTSAKAGEVTFTIQNKATDQVHEFVVLKTDLAADQLPLDGEGNASEEAGEVADEVEDIAIGQSTELKVNLQAGHYVLLCNLPGHYKSGMHAEFTVNP